MEIDEIRKKANEIERVSDLADLMTQIKKDEFGIKKYPFSSKQLFHYSSSKIVKNRYKTFKIRKKKPGEYREISAPNYELGIILYILNILLKSLFTPRDCVMGFTEGRSVVDNARVHVGHHYVFNIDLKNFFPSISQGRVWARLQCQPFNFSKDVASVVAGLCCNINQEGTHNVLPQGAPTSPILTNAICEKLDYLMLGVAKRFGLHYTRYADDMTFSSMHNVYQEGSDFRKEIKRIIEEQGFKMNDNKTRLYRDGQRQEVTGLTVNTKVNTARKYVRDLRCLLHVWEKEGYAKAYSYFYPLYKHDKGYIKKGEPVMENVIGGKLNYLRMVKGNNDSTYLKLLERYNSLQQVIYIDKETDKGENYIYVQPYTLQEFENYFDTKVTLEVSAKHKLIGRCTIANMDKILHISKSTQDELCKDVAKLETGFHVEAKELENCYVTLCRSKGKNFWLITKFEPKRSKCLSIQNVNVDIDKLLDVLKKRGLQEAANLFTNSLWCDYELSVNTQKKMLVNYLIRCKNMTYIQRKKCDELIARSCKITQDCSTLEESTSLNNNGSIDQAVFDDSLKVVSFENGEVIRSIFQKQESNDILDLNDEKETMLRNIADNGYKNSEVSKEVNCISDSDDNSNITSPNENIFYGSRGNDLDSKEYVNPKDMQDFLYDYNQNKILKLTCHTFDNEDDINMICNACGTPTYNLRTHSKLIGEEFRKLLRDKSENKKFLDPMLVTMINVYLTGHDLHGKKCPWSHNIKTTWNDDDFLKWGDENPGIIPSPGNNIIKSQKNKGYSLPEDTQFQTKIGKKRTIENFGELVIYFKSLFHIRKDNSMQDILSGLNEKYFNNEEEEDKAKFTFNEKRQGDDINLFVNVNKLAQAYKRIIDICLDKREEECYEFELSFYEENCGKILEIYHKNSIYNKSIRDCKRIGKDQVSLILNQINGLCNLYVEAEYRDGKSYRLNLWDNEDFKAVQIAPMKGVKYILKF